MIKLPDSNPNEVIIDRTIMSKYALHKLAENGGSLKFNHFGIRIVYNPNNPASPMVEARLFAVPIGQIYKGNINPSMNKAVKNAIKKKDEDKPIEVEEEEAIEM